MKIKMIQGLTGPGTTWHSGEVHDVPPAIAERYVKAGIAEHVGKAEGVKPSVPPAKRSNKATSNRAKASEKR
jgi:hypothetical protein